MIRSKLAGIPAFLVMAVGPVVPAAVAVAALPPAAAAAARACQFQVTSGPDFGPPASFHVKATINTCNYHYRAKAKCVPLHGTTQYPVGAWVTSGTSKATCPVLYQLKRGAIVFPESNPVTYWIWPT